MHHDTQLYTLTHSYTYIFHIESDALLLFNKGDALKHLFTSVKQFGNITCGVNFELMNPM